MEIYATMYVTFVNVHNAIDTDMPYATILYKIQYLYIWPRYKPNMGILVFNLWYVIDEPGELGKSTWYCTYLHIQANILPEDSPGMTMVHDNNTITLCNYIWIPELH